MMIFVAMKPTTAPLLLAVVALLIRTSVAVLPTISMPRSLTISKVQEAIQSAALKKGGNKNVNPKLDSFLNYLVTITPTEDSSSTTSSQADPADSVIRDNNMDSLIQINQQNEVAVDVLGQNSDGTTLESVLTKNGYQVINCYMNTCSIYIRADQIESLSKIPGIIKITLALPTLNRYQHDTDRYSDVTTDSHARRDSEERDLQGSVLSQAVRAMFVDTARSRYNNINGTGITIGILSDSFDCKGTQAQIDIQTGDLPPLSRINVLKDLNVSTSPSCSDEGRAMMQLVYDIVPGANFAYHTAFGGQAIFAAGIIALANAGCQIIVDDVIYFAEPFFQDGIVAIAVNEVASRGVSYFSSAGNSANQAWDGTKGFTNSSVKAFDGTLHSFGLDTNGTHVIVQPFRTTKRPDNIFVFQWDEPFISPKGNGGSRSDLDILVFDENGNVLGVGGDFNIGASPVEVFSFDTMNVTAAAFTNTVVVYVVISLFEGPPPTYMKIVSRSGTFNFSTGTEAASWGHSNAAAAAGVGAAWYINTPAYGVSPPIVEPFSSYGGIPFFFDADSNRLTASEIRKQPRFTGPDGVSNTFFGRNRTFFGTSASAPNVAGVAALMLQLHAAKNAQGIAPNELFKILESTAIDMTSTIGFDFITGYGFINASAALDAVSLFVSTKSPSKKPTKSPSKNPTKSPSKNPTKSPSKNPSKSPSKTPTKSPSKNPTKSPSKNPTKSPSKNPTKAPSKNPTKSPSKNPTKSPSKTPTKSPSKNPTKSPTKAPTAPIVVPVPIQAPINVPVTTKSPAKVPSTKPVTASPTAVPVNPPTNCGLFGLNFLCLPRGECGFFRRLFNINGC